MSDDARAAAAIRILEHLGYTYEGGELWRPPLGPAPDFGLVAERDAEIARLRARVETLEQELHEQCSAAQDAALERDRWQA